MPLEHILRAMQAQADSEIEGITRAAEAEIAQLIAEAEAQAQVIRARHRARVEPMLVTEVAALQNKAKLGALRATAHAREQLLADAFDQAQARLALIRESKEYAAIFRALAREAVEASGGDLIARVDPRDVMLARTAFVELGASAEVETQPIPLGGLEVMTRDERVAIINTLAARLQRARGVLRGPVARILTEEPSEKEWTTTTAMPTPA
jgi:vacuolar-type H+-ATPase subunit E/Vma4